MTSDSGYPDAMHDSFGPLLDSVRCPESWGERRCQLFAGHRDAHAHAWFEPPAAARAPRRGRYPWYPRIMRWTDDGERWFPPRGERLRWCCMFRP